MCIRKILRYNSHRSGFVPENENNVKFPCHDMRYMTLGLPYTRNALNWPFSSILKAINGPIPSYGSREKEFNFERKVTMEELFTLYWVYIPLSFKSKHNVHLPNSSLIDREPCCFSLMRFSLVGDWSGGGLAGRNLVSRFQTMLTRKSITFLLLLIIY